MTADPATAAPWTVNALLRWTTEHFAKRKIESPRLDAQILLSHVMNCRKIELVARSEEAPTDAERAAFKDLIKKRTDGWPVAYLTGKREFYLLLFAVSPAVLVPQPDTETLVLAALDQMKKTPNARILDLGTGSGCIAVSLAHQRPDAAVTAVDVSPDAAAVAAQNAATHNVSDRVAVLVGDLFAAVPAGATFDLIVSNPPYIASGELAKLPAEVTAQPRTALDGGPDGLAFYRRIAADAPKFLAQDGLVMVEIGYDQEFAVRTVFEGAGWLVGPTLKDGGRRPRVLTAGRP